MNTPVAQRLWKWGAGSRSADDRRGRHGAGFARTLDPRHCDLVRRLPADARTRGTGPVLHPAPIRRRPCGGAVDRRRRCWSL